METIDAIEVWYCRACGKAARPVMDGGCRCKSPVLPITPTRVTTVAAPAPPRRLRSADPVDALCRRGTRVEATITGTVVDAVSCRGEVTLIVERVTGERIAVTPARGDRITERRTL